MQKLFLTSILAISSAYSSNLSDNIETQITRIDQDTQNLSITIKLDKDELLYKDSFQATVNNRDIALSKPETTNTIVSVYDPAFKTTKAGYQNSVTYTLQAKKNAHAKINTGTVHIFFRTNKHKNSQERLISLNFETPEKNNKPVKNHIDQKINTVTAESTNAIPEIRESDNSPAVTTKPNVIHKIVSYVHHIAHQWKVTLSSLFETTGSRWLRLLVAFILGVLLSLTPCIYPMIPITVGVLQSTQNKSVLRNFAVACAYTLGISCTFAIFGFITAVGSRVFGELQNTAWIALPLIALLIYLGLSMFGLYEMYVPKFMQPKTGPVKGGSFTSAFVFGALSGTIASPCLSPGLALILAHVAKITQTGNILSYLDGFFMLFFFGIGSSLPLLIIGTFSTSLNILPKAGLWMVEVKRLLGLMLLLMAFYQLEKFIPWFILSWFIVAFLLATGIYYFIDIKSYDSNAIRRYKHIMGVALIVSACLMAVKAYKAYYIHMHPEQITSNWLTDYDKARKQAVTEHKKLLLDFSTENCALCKVLEKRFQETPEIAKALEQFVLVKIDGTQSDKEPFMHLQKLLQIRGFPTVALLEPENELVIKQWAGDIGSTESFVKDLNQLAK